MVACAYGVLQRRLGEVDRNHDAALLAVGAETERVIAEVRRQQRELEARLLSTRDDKLSALTTQQTRLQRRLHELTTVLAATAPALGSGNPASVVRATKSLARSAGATAVPPVIAATSDLRFAAGAGPGVVKLGTVDTRCVSAPHCVVGVPSECAPGVPASVVVHCNAADERPVDIDAADVSVVVTHDVTAAAAAGAGAAVTAGAAHPPTVALSAVTRQSPGVFHCAFTVAGTACSRVSVRASVDGRAIGAAKSVPCHVVSSERSVLEAPAEFKHAEVTTVTARLHSADGSPVDVDVADIALVVEPTMFPAAAAGAGYRQPPIGNPQPPIGKTTLGLVTRVAVGVYACTFTSTHRNAQSVRVHAIVLGRVVTPTIVVPKWVRTK